ncbi:hypothetical protein [Jannaschia sp. 2305UL9-9]|uniref:hypothetical protein n=1 Tax=Jannaschia sp. 2305UL9-9 TaxID=3121638 RepID=UPI0035275486
MVDDAPATRTWHIHLGAHKTATTHLQDALSARKDALQGDGVFYLPHAEARPLLQFRDVPLSPLMRLRRRLAGETWWPDRAFGSARHARACATELVSVIGARAETAHRVVLSEENLLGRLRSVFTGDYFAGSPRLNLLGDLATRVPVHLYLAVRPLDTFLPSAYAQALRTLPADRLNFPETVARVQAHPPSWADLAQAICDRVPRAHLTIWEYGAYAAHGDAIRRLITGLPGDDDPSDPRPTRTLSPSARAIHLAEQLPEADWTKRAARVERIYGDHPRSDREGPHRPFDAAARARLQAAYRDDLARMARMPRVRVVQFGEA